MEVVTREESKYCRLLITRYDMYIIEFANRGKIWFHLSGDHIYQSIFNQLNMTDSCIPYQYIKLENKVGIGKEALKLGQYSLCEAISFLSNYKFEDLHLDGYFATVCKKKVGHIIDGCQGYEIQLD